MKLINVLHDEEKRLFTTLPRILYKDDPEFISHLDQDIDKVFDESLIQEGVQDFNRWILMDDGNVIGKIAAFYSENLKIAGIGFFDCIDDVHAAEMLFSAAESWLKQNGYTEIQAPINFGERDKYWGLLVEGFKDPSYQENYNFPYYKRLFELNGYEKEFEQTTSEASPENVKSQKLINFNDIGIPPEYEFRHLQKKRLMSYAKDFAKVYNSAWRERDFFAPVSEEKIKKMLKSMRPILRDDIIWFAYFKGEPVAFFVNIIDVNQIFKKLNGRFDWWGKLKFLWYKSGTKVSRIRGIVFGIAPEHRGKGLYMGMIAKVYQVLKNDPDLKSAELSWIGDFNPKMLALLNKVGAVKTKTHVTYKKHL